MSGALAELHQDLQDLVGRTIADRYRVDELVGVGGMAAVFRARHLGLKRDVALKVLHPHLVSNREISSRFDREAESASRLDHPNTIHVTDFGSTENGMKFMVMQLLSGRELGELLEQPLPPLRAVELVLQILRGLDHAHKHGVIHRDVKPENIFITRDHEGRETIKLVDFGISKIFGGDPDEVHKTTAGLVFGTPAYMSPEQAAGMEADGRTDLYSVGIILYQMLSGRLPFDSDDPVALVRMQVGRDPDPLPSSVPPVLAGIVQRLLEKDREERYSSAGEIIEHLEAIVPILQDGSPGDLALGDSNRISVDAPIEFTRSMTTARAITGSVPFRTYTTPTPSSLLTTQNGARPATTPPGSARESPRRWPLFAAGAAGFVCLAVVTTVLVVQRDVAERTDVPRSGEVLGTAQADMVIDDDEDVGGRERPDPDAVAKIDRLILGGQLDEAEELLKPLRDVYPDEPELLWRQGRILVKQKRKYSQALAAYGGALAASPALMDDRDFYAELYDLLRNRRLRDEALDLALQKMGSHGHMFLLELVNDSKHPLDYHDRRRALDELAKNPSNQPLINRKLNMALDLLQASKSLTPCRAYRDATVEIAAAPDYYFYPRVDKAGVPTTPGPGLPGVSEEDPATCAELPRRREELLVQLAALAPNAGEGVEAEDTDAIAVLEEPVPAARDEGRASAPAGTETPAGDDDAGGKSNTAKNETSGKAKNSRSNSADCRKFGAPLFNKKCRR